MVLYINSFWCTVVKKQNVIVKINRNTRIKEK